MSPIGTENQIRLFTLSPRFDNDEETDLILGNLQKQGAETENRV